MIQSAYPSDRDILRRLAKAAGPAHAPEGPPATDYDYATPSRYSPSQLAQLQDVAGRVAAQLAPALEEALRREVKVSAQAVRQQYGPQVLAAVEQQRAFVVPLSVAGRVCGALVMPGPCASGWVQAMLGGGGKAVDRELSNLELALLQDVAASACGAIAKALGQAGAKLNAGAVARQKGFDAGEGEYCCFDLSAGKEQDLVLVLASEMAETVIGAPPPVRPADQVRRDLTAYVGLAVMKVTAYLPPAALTMRHVSSLEEGDVVLLAATADDPVDLRSGGALVARGLLAQSDGRYSLQIVTGPAALGSVGVKG